MATTRLSAEAVRERRMRAARLFKKGHSQADVARRCGVSRPTAWAWYHSFEQGGRAALVPKAPGRPRRLDDKQIARIEKALLEGPQAHGWSTQLWTLERVAKLIGDLTGVKYHGGHVWRLLRSMGWSRQRPTTRARERDEQAIAHWKRQGWALVKRGRDRAGRSSS